MRPGPAPGPRDSPEIEFNRVASPEEKITTPAAPDSVENHAFPRKTTACWEGRESGQMKQTQPKTGDFEEAIGPASRVPSPTSATDLGLSGVDLRYYMSKTNFESACLWVYTVYTCPRFDRRYGANYGSKSPILNLGLHNHPNIPVLARIPPSWLTWGDGSSRPGPWLLAPLDACMEVVDDEAGLFEHLMG